ncbi:MAG: hypothetical protein JNK48_32630 [Bryobacterales bacterium]|nr:hypothetical protein [Bryobacterales bacterium]
MSKIERSAIAFVSVAFTCAFFINYCNLIYQCGCTFLWSGAAAHCNIHHGPKHCPWCSIGDGAYLVLLFLIVPQVVVSFWPRPWRWHMRLAAALLAFPIAGLIPAIALGIWQGYWN